MNTENTIGENNTVYQAVSGNDMNPRTAGLIKPLEMSLLNENRSGKSHLGCNHISVGFSA